MRRIPRGVLRTAALVCGGMVAGHSAAFLRAYPPAPQSLQAPARPQASERDVEPNAARRTVETGDFYDSGNPDRGKLQAYSAAVARLPKDANGFPDWMQALREKKIGPKASLLGAGEMRVLQLDVIMRNTKDMPYVRFPHESHTQWLDCGNCHPQPFEPRAGAAKITMTDIFRGRYCGMCHDRVAFITFFSCQRCHSVPRPGEAMRQ